MVALLFLILVVLIVIAVLLGGINGKLRVQNVLLIEKEQAKREKKNPRTPLEKKLEGTDCA